MAADPERRFARPRDDRRCRHSSGSSYGASRNRASRGFSRHAIWRSPWKVCLERRRPRRCAGRQVLRGCASRRWHGRRRRARARAVLHAVGAVAERADRLADRSQRAAGRQRLNRRVHQLRVRPDDDDLAERRRDRVSSTESRGRELASFTCCDSISCRLWRCPAPRTRSLRSFLRTDSGSGSLPMAS